MRKHGSSQISTAVFRRCRLKICGKWTKTAPLGATVIYSQTMETIYITTLIPEPT
jgi:hypothetical protein